MKHHINGTKEASKQTEKNYTKKQKHMAVLACAEKHLTKSNTLS